MRREFIETPSFTKRWFALGFNDDDLAELQQFLIKNPEAGDVMIGTGGLKKIRFAFQGRGKSGSARVCYVDFATFCKNLSDSSIFKGRKTESNRFGKEYSKKSYRCFKNRSCKELEERA
ncbi:addiction module toxin RelE [Treponema vincentii]|uniref:addiction module toxin RelE n=1 Tax=Treponema vincentii TaxID=69710 RepID=UPI001E2D8FE0|nr:addiction module toxin RelE [Treponema vincentii]